MSVESDSIKERFDYLRSLETGWLDGEGQALDESGLNQLQNNIQLLYHSHGLIPYIYPTVQSGVSVEWVGDDMEVEIEIEPVQLSGSLKVTCYGEITSNRPFSFYSHEDIDSLNDCLTDICQKADDMTDL